ncbi:acyl-CoA N-acyltransferase [Hysterangium stoloniferum]|nr:acyl-CoA N-acyltransferase [Hysterangium stoloniferum]
MTPAAHSWLTNPRTNEPYIRLPAPHARIILTPPRTSDADAAALIPIMNDPRVVKWLGVLPYPYEPKHALEWLQASTEKAYGILRDIEAAPDRGARFSGGCPFRIVREVKEDGSDVYLGDCRLARWTFDDVLDMEEKDRLIKENEARAAGDSEIEWSFGDYLAPSHHGRGIMSAVIKILIEQWVIPSMGAKKITVSPFEGNHGSVRVFEKNGFVLEKVVDYWRTLPEYKGKDGTGIVRINILRWRK